MHSFKSIKVIDSGKSIILQRSDDTYVRYHSTWLRDNALDEKTRDINSGQRLITISDIPTNISIKSAKLDKAGKNIFLTFLPENKNVSFSRSVRPKYCRLLRYFAITSTFFSFFIFGMVPRPCAARR